MKRVLPAALVFVLAMAAARAQTPGSISDSDWKRWLDRVDPLMQQSERKEVKATPPADRAKFEEDFWRARNPDPSKPDNPVRAQLELRIQAAEKQFLIGGRKWTDCGRTFVVLGAPDSQKHLRVAPHYAGTDPVRAFQNQDQAATEEWTYLTNPRLPPTPDGYVFRFNAACKSVSGRSGDDLLDRVAASYVVHPR